MYDFMPLICVYLRIHLNFKPSAMVWYLVWHFSLTLREMKPKYPGKYVNVIIADSLDLSSAVVLTMQDKRILYIPVKDVNNLCLVSTTQW